MALNTDFPRIADADYEFLCHVVYEQSRIHLGPDKRGLVTSRLGKRLRHLRLSTYAEYCRLLRSPEGPEELQFLIDRISTNHTHFFREMKHFSFLETVILPKWKEAFSGSDPLRVWSSACSSGEEPYSIAIWLAEKLAPAATGRWLVEASDISTRVLDLARRGIYESERLGDISPECLRRHFQKGMRDWAGHFRVKDELRRQVRFHHLNLLEGAYPFSHPFHLIFCRNVMIYFDRATQTELIARLASVLLPGGYLFVGHSESLSGIKHGLRPIQPAVYQKP